MYRFQLDVQDVSNKTNRIMIPYNFLKLMHDFEKYSNIFLPYLISFLVNFHCELWYSRYGQMRAKSYPK